MKVPGAPRRFCAELVWREFAWHLFYHAPEMDRATGARDWDGFPWRGDDAAAEAWRRGRTGVPLVDAAMREMYVTGRMHNRARMIVASYLTKNLLTDWRVGLRWFAGLPDRLGSGLERDGLAMGGRVGPGRGAVISASSTQRPRPKSSTRTAATAGAGSPRVGGSHRPPRSTSSRRCRQAGA